MAASSVELSALTLAARTSIANIKYLVFISFLNACFQVIQTSLFIHKFNPFFSEEGYSLFRHVSGVY
jgi:hypothetical protein